MLQRTLGLFETRSAGIMHRAGGGRVQPEGVSDSNQNALSEQS